MINTREHVQHFTQKSKSADSLRGPVWPSGKGLGWYVDDTRLIPRFGSLFCSRVVGHWHCIVTLPLTVNETSKWLSSLPILMQNHSGGDIKYTGSSSVSLKCNEWRTGQVTAVQGKQLGISAILDTFLAGSSPWTVPRWHSFGQSWKVRWHWHIINSTRSLLFVFQVKGECEGYFPKSQWRD